MTAMIEVCKKKRHILPIEKFVNGKVDQSHADDLQCRLLGRTDSAKLQEKNQRIMVTESEHLTYVGKNFGQSKLQHSQNLMKHYVGVYDKKTGKMKVYDTEMFTMMPQIQGKDKDETDMPVTEKSFREKTDMLTTAFGSSKKRRTLDTRTRHAVDDSTLEGVLKSTVDHGVKEAASYQTKKEEKVDTTEVSTIPPCNKDAKTPEEAYSLSDILTDRDLNDLHNSAKGFFDSTVKQVIEWEKEKKYPAYVIKKLQEMPLSDESRWFKSKCLLYINYMIGFYCLQPKQIGKSDAFPESCPLAIRQKILNNFSQVVQDGNRSTRLRPSRLKDRLVSYILTLALIIDEFSLLPIDLQKDLKLGRIKMANYLRALGCKITQSKDAEGTSYAAFLRVPLVFPKPKSAVKL